MEDAEIGLRNYCSAASVTLILQYNIAYALFKDGVTIVKFYVLRLRSYWCNR